MPEACLPTEPLQGLGSSVPLMVQSFPNWALFERGWPRSLPQVTCLARWSVLKNKIKILPVTTEFKSKWMHFHRSRMACLESSDPNEKLSGISNSDKGPWGTGGRNRHPSGWLKQECNERPRWILIWRSTPRIQRLRRRKQWLLSKLQQWRACKDLFISGWRWGRQPDPSASLPEYDLRALTMPLTPSVFP